MIIQVDARRIRKNHLVLRTINDKICEHKVIGITERKVASLYGYKFRQIKYEDGSVTQISLSPAIIGGWLYMRLKLVSILQIILLPLLIDAVDKFKYYDYIRIFLMIIISIILISYIF